mgnify:CR=1 FL=1
MIKRKIKLILIGILFTAPFACDNISSLITPVTYFGNYSAPLRTGDDPALATWNFPNGIATDNNGNIWQCDTGNDRLVIMTPDLKTILKVFGETGSAPGQFNMVFRIAAHPEKNWMYVTDMNNNRVQIISYTSNYDISVEKTFGEYGYNGGQFNGPNAIAVAKIDGKIKVVVSDEFAGKETMGRLEVFDESGNFIKKIDTILYNGNEYSMLWPQGISIDKNGLIYIGDTGHYRVLRTDINGNGVPFYNNEIVLPMPVSGNWVFPRGVNAIGDKLYVQDTGANLLTVYNLDGTFLGPLMREGSPVFYGPIEVTPLKDNPNKLVINENAWPRTTLVDVTDINNTITEGTAGRPRTNEGMFSYASSIKLSTDGDLYALDGMNFRIQRWTKNSSGTFEYKSAYYVPFFSSAINMLKEQNKFLISSPYESKVHIYDAATSTSNIYGFITPEVSFGSYGTGDGQFLVPRAMCVVDNTIYVIDTGNNRVSVWDYDTEAGIAVFQKHIGEGSLEYISGVAVGPNGNIYVPDMYKNKVNIFSSNGELINEFGSLGYEKHNFSLPTGIAIADGVVYITDLVSRSIKGFDLDGNFLGIYYRNFGTTLGGMWFPFTPEIVDKTIYLTDATHNRVNVFKIDNTVDYISAHPNFYAGLYNFYSSFESLDNSKYIKMQKLNIKKFMALSKSLAYKACINLINAKKEEIKSLQKNGSSGLEISIKSNELKDLIIQLKNKILKNIQPVR